MTPQPPGVNEHGARPDTALPGDPVARDTIPLRLLERMLAPLAQCACVYAPQGRLLLANPSLARWLGIRDSDLLGRSLFEIWPADFATREAEDLILVLQSGRLEQLETRPGSGGPRPVRAVKYPLRISLEGSADCSAVVVLFHEEPPPGPTAELSLANPETLGWLALGIIHDFNNALMLLRGQAELLEVLMTQQRNGLVEINRLLDHATALPQQLLAFTRQTPPTRQVVDLHLLLGSLEGLLRGRLRSPRLRLELRLERAWVEGDSVQLTQAFVNVAGNALDAMGEQGTLLIETARRGAVVEVSFQDTGPGMSREVLARIFERSYTTRPNGAGLGLMVVDEVVRRHGGRITCRSQPGEGTRFVIELPARGGAGGDESPRICVVDPAPDIARLTVMMLEQEGHAATGYSSLEEVCRVEGPVAGVVVEATLLDEAGVAQLERWLAAHADGWLVVTSAGTLPALTEACRKRLRGIVHKPYSVEALSRAVHGP